MYIMTKNLICDVW